MCPGLDGERDLTVGLHAPENGAELVRSAVADLPAARLQEPAEGAWGVARVVRPPAKRPQPKVPIQLRGRGTIGDWVLIHRVGIVPAGDLRDLTHNPVANRSAGVPSPKARPPLRSHLHRAVILPGGGDHRPAFFNRHRGRLFHIDVLARFAGVDRLHRMPMVRGGEDHCVDVLAEQDVAVVAEGLDARAGQLQGARQAAIVHVADRGDVDLPFAAELEHVVQVARAHAAHTDMGHRQPLRRARLPRRPEHAGRDKIGQAHGRHRTTQKLPPSQPGRFPHDRPPVDSLFANLERQSS